MIKQCKQHLIDVGEDYFTHMGFALKIGGLSLCAAFFLITHAFLPCFFLDNGSRTIKKTMDIIQARRDEHAKRHHHEH